MVPDTRATGPLSQTEPGPPLDCDSPQARRWAVALWVIVAIGLVGMALPAVADLVQRVDDAVRDVMVALEQDVLVAAAEFLDVFGGTVVMAIAVVVVALILAWLRRWPGLVVWLVTVGLSQFLNALIKSTYERARPLDRLVEEHSSSFVSGHSLTAAALAIALVLVFVPAGGRRRTWLIVAVAYAVLVAASRVYLRAHWLSDVSFGLAVGAACAVTVALVASWWHAREEAE